MLRFANSLNMKLRYCCPCRSPSRHTLSSNNMSRCRTPWKNDSQPAHIHSHKSLLEQFGRMEPQWPCTAVTWQHASKTSRWLTRAIARNLSSAHKWIYANAAWFPVPTFDPIQPPTRTGTHSITPLPEFWPCTGQHTSVRRMRGAVPTFFVLAVTCTPFIDMAADACNKWNKGLKPSKTDDWGNWPKGSVQESHGNIRDELFKHKNKRTPLGCRQSIQCHNGKWPHLNRIKEFSTSLPPFFLRTSRRWRLLV